MRTHLDRDNTLRIYLLLSLVADALLSSHVLRTQQQHDEMI